MFNAEIFIMIDLENSNNDHVSISGGKATHDFRFIEKLKASTLDDLKKLVIANYGKHYDAIENRLFIDIPQNDWSNITCPENYEAIFTEVTEVEINMES